VGYIKEKRMYYDHYPYYDHYYPSRYERYNPYYDHYYPYNNYENYENVISQDIYNTGYMHDVSQNAYQYNSRRATLAKKLRKQKNV
jgi:hypothetical protein